MAARDGGTSAAAVAAAASVTAAVAVITDSEDFQVPTTISYVDILLLPLSQRTRTPVN